MVQVLQQAATRDSHDPVRQLIFIGCSQPDNLLLRNQAGTLRPVQIGYNVLAVIEVHVKTINIKFQLFNRLCRFRLNVCRLGYALTHAPHSQCQQCRRATGRKVLLHFLSSVKGVRVEEE